MKNYKIFTFCNHVEEHSMWSINFYIAIWSIKFGQSKVFLESLVTLETVLYKPGGLLCVTLAILKHSSVNNFKIIYVGK